jgi:dihydrofolate reductase
MIREHYKIIVAYDDKRGIGKGLDIPWHISEDLKRFKELTLNQNIIMGSNTYQSIINMNGKPLPKRNNIVLSKRLTSCEFDNVSFYSNYHDVLNKFENAWVIGGGEVYKVMLPHASKLYITKIKGDYNCDIFFPEIKTQDWQLIENIEHDGYSYLTYNRVGHH